MMQTYVLQVRRWRLPALIAVSLLISGLAMQSAIAAKPVAPTFVDYAQCANGAPPSTSLACPEGWINGILQASNSHYSEDQVTPQRAELNLPAGASTAASSHSMTFTYQARKGSAQTHAYDSLATWNWTQRSADRCTGLASTDCVGGTPSTLPIPPDNTALEPHTAPSGTATGPHMLPASSQTECDVFATTVPSRCFIMYGGILDGVSAYTHSCTATGDCANPSVDDYATVTISFHTATTPQKVQLLFGGHLAVGSQGGSRTWGLGNGASDISGGPYHIKWEAADGASIGNRDNQIMGSAIIFNDTSSSTQVKDTKGTVDTADDTNIADGGTVSIGTQVYDTATLSGASGAGGTVTYYYAATPTTCATGTQIGSPVTVSGGVVPASATITLSAAGTYEFWAFYSGDSTHGESTSLCGSETVVVSRNSPAAHSTPVVQIKDTFSITGFSADATGSVTVGLYTSTDCTTGQQGSDATFTVAQATAGAETSFVAVVANTYYYKISYAQDANNNAINSCQEIVGVSITSLP
jgi:hypothetical protein